MKYKRREQRNNKKREKEQREKKREKEQKKTNLSEPTQVFCGLLSLLFKNPLRKIKGIGATPIVVSFAAVAWSRHRTHSIPR